jgi:ABC-type glycerol-3-phosphate transport system substrate-binding protein
MKKVVLILSVLFLIAGMCFASGGGEKKPDGAGQGEKISIRFQDWRLAEEPSGSILRGIIAEYEKAHPDVSITIEPVSAADRKKTFIVQSEGKSAPDLSRCVPADIPDYADKGYLFALDGLAAGDSGFASRYQPHLIKAGTWKGKLYAVPMEGDVYILYVNKDLYTKAGFDVNTPPKTWDEWLNVMKKINNPANRVYGTVIQAKKDAAPPAFLQAFFLANGANFFNDDYSDVIFDNPKGIEAFKFFTELYTVNKLTPNPNEIGYNEQVTMFASGNIGTLMCHGVGWGVILAKNKDIADKVISFPLPGAVKATAARGSVYVISSQTKQAEAVYDLAKFITNKENQLKFWDQGKVYPALLEALNSPNVMNDPVGRTVLGEAANGVSAPLTPAWPQTSDALMNAITEAYLGVKTPEQALKDAAVTARKVLAEVNKK